jgi:hypothetical protein
MISLGDVVTFEELYAQQYAPMVRLAHTLVDTRQGAEEVVQDASMCTRANAANRPEAYLRDRAQRVPTHLRRRMLSGAIRFRRPNERPAVSHVVA